MGEKIKNIFGKIKDWWSKLSKVIKRMIVIGLSLILVTAIGLTVWLNVSKNGYIVLFPGMSTDESTEVYKYLQSENVPTQINAQGEIMVPESQWDTLVYELAEKGYPQSAPSYGTYFDNLSMTMTDSEKQQLIIKDLQDRLQVTLNRIDGVKGSVVTIQYPEKSNYAWKENNETASASVMLTLALRPLRVTAWLRYVSPSRVISSVSFTYSPESSTTLGSVTAREILAAALVVVVVTPEEITTLILSSAVAVEPAAGD